MGPICPSQGSAHPAFVWLSASTQSVPLPSLVTWLGVFFIILLQKNFHSEAFWKRSPKRQDALPLTKLQPIFRHHSHIAISTRSKGRALAKGLLPRRPQLRPKKQSLFLQEPATAKRAALKSPHSSRPHCHLMVSEGKYSLTCLWTTGRFPWNSRCPLSISNLRRNLRQRILVAGRGGGSREKLNKAPILLSTGACNRTPGSKATHGRAHSGAVEYFSA